MMHIPPARAFGLRQKFLLAFLSVVLGLVAGLLLLVERRQRLTIVHEIEKRGLTIATHLAAVSTKSLLTYNFVALEQDAEKVSQDQDILYTIVLDREGRVAAYSGHDEYQGLRLPDPVSQHAMQVTAPLVQHVPPRGGDPEHYDIAVPVLVPGSADKWGTVRVGLAVHEMHTAIHQTRVQVLLLGIGGVVLSSVAAVLLARRMTAPLRILTEGTMAVARGDLQQTITVPTRDELAVLAANFNHMTRELAQKIHELALLANYNANILTSLTSGLWTLDLAGRVATANPAADTIMGVSADTIRGHSFEQVFAQTPQLLQVIATSRAHQTSLTVPRLTYTRPDGQRVPMSVRTAMLRDTAGTVVGLLVMGDDLSPLQTLERQLRRADQLAALGQMAAGVAHEIKNPLASVRSLCQLVRRKHTTPGFLDTFDRIVLREVDRINRIVEEMLALARPFALQCVPLAVTTVVHSVLEVYADRMEQQQVVLKTRWGTNLPLILADAEYLYRAVANLVLNALDAMPAGGELTLACRSVPAALREAAAADGSQGREAFWELPALAQALYTSHVEVVIRDSGGGMAPEQLALVFTPFHTTKAHGTGLGLALTHKIIAEHHGTIQMTSQVGQGTTVTLTLPVAPPGACLPGAAA